MTPVSREAPGVGSGTMKAEASAASASSHSRDDRVAGRPRSDDGAPPSGEGRSPPSPSGRSTSDSRDLGPEVILHSGVALPGSALSPLAGARRAPPHLLNSQVGPPGPPPGRQGTKALSFGPMGTKNADSERQSRRWKATAPSGSSARRPPTTRGPGAANLYHKPGYRAIERCAWSDCGFRKSAFRGVHAPFGWALA
jgi:hypothetical protein